MKMLTTCLVVLALTAGVAAAQTIDEIQEYNPADGSPASPYVGQTVTVTGTVYVTAGTYNNGTHYIQGATGGISFFQSGTGLQLGDQVEVTGTVGDFSGEIQIESPSITTTGSGDVPAPTPYTPAEVVDDYELVGNFVSVIGTVTSKEGSQFTLGTGGEEDLIVYIDSTTGIDLGAVQVGDEYQVISPVVVFNGLIELKPRFQADLIEDPTGDTLPVISDVTADNFVPLQSTPVTISASITDNSGVQSATLYHRDADADGPLGSWMSVAMTSAGGDLYEATIPGGHAGSEIEYYLEATDDGAQTVTLPGDAPDGFYELAVGLTSIYEMQYVHPDSANQDSEYLDRVVNVGGVVTAGTGEAGAPSRFVVQAQEEGPYGGYAYGGILVYEGSATYEYFRGDVVEIGGYGEEYFGLTEIEPHNPDAVNLVAFGSELPPASRVSTGVLADDTLEDGDGIDGEAWESVWVKTFAAQVVDTLGFGEYIVSDTGARADSVVVDPAVDLTYVPTIGDVIFAEGYVDYEFGAFQVTPIADEFVTLTEWTGVEDETPQVQAAGGFESIYPNPFNPATKINFVLNRDELTQLNIYNLRGELVRSLVNERLPMGTYQLSWDGKDAGGQSVASGAYFARLRIGKEVLQVRKLSLVK
jgi:hypothetical protein